MQEMGSIPRATRISFEDAKEWQKHKKTKRCASFLNNKIFGE
jgi:hypothetical protein